jgi:hypothetical protein
MLLRSQNDTVRWGDFLSEKNVSYHRGRAIPQAASRWLPTTAARVWQVGFVAHKVALGQDFSEYFGFPCQSLFHQIVHHHNHPGQVQ